MKKIGKLIIITCLLNLFMVTLAAQTYTWKNVEIAGGGFVPGIIYNRSEAGLVYARTDIGGAYRLDRNTGRWIPLLDAIGWDDWNLTGVLSLATDPVDPNRVYAACGSYTNSWDPKNGAILRSTDKGATWQKTELPFKIGGNMPGRGCGERLAIDPNKNSILYFGAPGNTATAFGLWKSTDYGASWSKVAGFPNPGDYIDDPADTNDYLNHYQGIYWVVFDEDTGTPGNATQTIYAGVGDKDGTCLYRTTNGGTSWELVPGQPTSLPCPHKGKLDTANNYLYIAYSDNGGPYDGQMGDVWRYHTASGEWVCIGPVENNGVPGDGDNYFGYSGLTIDRKNPAVIMVTGYSVWWPDTMIWRSTDYGNTWTKIWDWVSYPTRSFRYTLDISAAPWLNWGTAGTEPELSPKLGWMTESLEINPFNSDEMMYGTGATIYGTDNLTRWDSGSTITLKVKAMGLEETSVLSLISLPEGAPLLSGLGDIYGFRHTNLDKVPAAFFTNPRIATSSMDYAELKPGFIYRVGKGGDTVDYVEQKNSGYSTDGGATWSMNWNEPSGITDGGTVAVGADGKNVVWSPKGSVVSYSPQSGSSWQSSTGIPAEAVVASDRVNPSRFYGFKAGKFYVSMDGGATFSSTVTAGLPVQAALMVKAVPGHEGEVWAAGGSTGDTYGLWHSASGGTSFTKLANIEEADAVGFGKAAPGRTYPAVYTSARLNGVRGIYRSDDAGATWVRINDDRHQWGWTGAALTGDPRVYGRVYIGTNGRGIIYGDISGNTPVPTRTPTHTRSATSTPTGIPGILGDVNNSRTIDIVDALMTAQYSVGLVPQGFNAGNADVNCDGTINIVDALMIAQFYVGLTGAFTCR